MWPSTIGPLSSWTRNITLGSASVTSPSISMASSFAGPMRACCFSRCAALDAILRAREAERVALIDGETRVSFARAYEMIERLAGWFASLLDAPGEVVSWQLPSWWEAAIVHHAALRAGAIPNPLPVALRERELQFVL